MPDRSSDLDQAIRQQDWQAALRLVQEGADISSVDSAIYYLARSEEPELLRLCLEAGANPNHRSSPRPLQLAASAGLIENVRFLLEYGADPGTGTSIATPLSNAVEEGHDVCAAELVRAGAKGTGGVLDLKPPVVEAAFAGLAQTLEAMIEAGFDLEIRGTIHHGQIRAARQALDGARAGLSKLFGLIEGLDQAGSIEELVEISKDVEGIVSAAHVEAPEPVDDLSYENATPMIVAAGEGHDAIVKALAAAGADPSSHDDSELTPAAAARRAGHTSLADWIETAGGSSGAQRSPTQELFVAVEAGETERVTELLTSGAEIDARDERAKSAGRTPLLTAVLAQQPEVVDLLLNQGAAVDLADREASERRRLAIMGPPSEGVLERGVIPMGLTPVMVAAIIDDAEATQRLAASGANLDLLSDTRHTALMIAIANENEDAVKALIEAGANLDVAGPNRSTALAEALEVESPELVELLIAGGADVNARTEYAPLLNTAIDGGDDRLVEAFLEAGADPRARDADGKNALELARKNQQEGFEKLRDRTIQKIEAALRIAEDSGSPEPEAPESLEITLPELSEADAAHYDMEAVLARLQAAAETEDFQQAVHRLEELAGAKPADHLETTGAFFVEVPSDLNLDMALAQKEMAEKDCLLLDNGSYDSTSLILLPTADRYEALAALGTNGANYDITNTQIIAFFKDLETRHPYEIQTLGHDRVYGRLLEPPEDAGQLARELYAICSDIVDQGSGSIEDLIEDLESSGKFYCWWD